MSFKQSVIWLFCLTLIGLGIYIPGLSGGFLFDDYGGLIFNEGIRIHELSWLSIWQGAWSYGQVGPLGRPIAMGSFAIDYWAHGIDAFWTKFENLLIHLLNGCLVYIFTVRIIRRVSGCQQDKQGAQGFDPRPLALFVAGWWLLAPLAVTSVLYVIQRMTSLAATFTLLGLLGYLHFRERAETTRRARWNGLALVLLLLGTALSAYTKESGLLTIGFAWLLEVMLFANKQATGTAERLWKWLCYLAPLLVAVLFVGYLLQHHGWLDTRVPGRDFSPWERLLSQGRVLAFYLRQIVFPDIAHFGLYHDDFLVSRGWFAPSSTLWSATFHGVLLSVALVFWRSFPLFALGISWFYMGHLLESSVWPLEMIHEHRNYLPMWGVMLAVAGVAFKLTTNFRAVRLPLAVVVLLAFSAVTLSRTHGMGGGADYFLNEARLHPRSARANYDAAVALLKIVQRDPGKLGELGPKIATYLGASKLADQNALAPFLGEITLSVIQDRRSPESLNEFEHRLLGGVPPAAIHMIFLGLMDVVDQGSASFTDDDMERLFVAALANPELSGIGRTSVQANYGVFLAQRRGNVDRAKVQLLETLQRTPAASEVRLIYAEMLIGDGLLDEARMQIETAQNFDKFGYHKKLVNDLSRLLESKVNGEKK